MSNVESLDGQTFLSYLVDSFINVFQLQVYISVSFPKRTVQWGGGGGPGVRGLGPGGVSGESFGRGHL